MEWHSPNVPVDWMREHLERLVSNMGGVPSVGFGAYHGERDSRGRQALRAWIVSDEALFRFDVSAGGDKTMRGPDGTESAWKLTGDRIEWVDAPALEASAWNKEGRGRDRDVGIRWTLDGFELARGWDTARVEGPRTFAIEYWKRRPAR